MLQSMFTIQLDTSTYNIVLLNDLARMFIIQLVAQVLFFLRYDNLELFSMVFIESTLFILLGILVYWLIFNNIITFTTTDTKDKSLDTYYQSVYTL